MQQIIVAFDSLHFSESTLRYALYLGRQNKAHLAGVFLDNPYYESCALLDTFSEDDDDVAIQNRIKRLKQKDNQVKAAGLRRFEEECKEAGIKYTLHHADFQSKDLVHETIFADLLIINAREQLGNAPRQTPSSFIKNLLKETHCPVLLVPETFTPIQHVVVLYNGDPSAVMATKMFNYLFPNLDELPTQIICAQEPGASDEIPDGQRMKEWVQWHFSSINYELLPQTTRKELLKELKKKHGNALIIAGAYHRSTASMLLQPSLADSIIRQLDNPLFISHY